MNDPVVPGTLKYVNLDRIQISLLIWMLRIDPNIVTIKRVRDSGPGGPGINFPIQSGPKGTASSSLTFEIPGC